MKKIKGPLVQLTAGSIVYQVTLASGMVITNPATFGDTERALVSIPAIVSETGQVLAPQKTSDAPFSRFETLAKALVAIPREALDEAERD